ncbi:3-phosphoserine/phosphohydroxythreonine transaminase [Aequoribacter sp.]|uniref:3-phosphoserine/phosphohydroxythreonine transaminase n=1 Tax=Aequoribacter sp. TaxID=2847771 RepID=UPI003F69B2BD
MSRVFNFCAGPAALPEAVLSKAQADLMDWQGRGLSIMEMSHRSDEIVSIANEAEASLRRLMGISDDYAVLFLQGGASQQFAAVPLNLAAGNQAADYVNTGQWSKKAISEAKRFADVSVVASSEDRNFSYVPAVDSWARRDNAAYVHICPNETIGGVAYSELPTGETPIVADMSSTILSQPINVNDYGVIYAGAQKNIGPAGLTVVIVRKDLLGKASEQCPTMLNWQVAADNDSMYNTPPTFAIYLAGLVFEWLEDLGGLGAMAEINQRKAGKLYDYIDGSGFYANPVALPNRSLMNVPFTLADAALDKTFLAGADAAGLLNLKGHRSVGGMRASIYNAVPEAGVDALIDYMRDFASNNG